MFRQLDFRSFFNFLGRNKLYTAINIFGLSLSLMFVILIADYTVRQLTVDSFHSKAGRIYVVSNENTVASAYFLQKHLLDRYPEIEATCAVSFEDHHTVEADGKLALADVLYADTTFFRIFDFELAAGDRRQALAARDNVVLSESFARRMFGDADPVGRSLVAEGKSYTVSAVMRDIERSVIPPVDLLYRGDLLTKKNNNNESMSNVGSCCTFLLAREGADLRAKLPDMLDYFKTIYLPYIRDFYRQVTLLPLREVYFSPLDSYGNLSSGNRSFVTILMAIGIVILLFAVINYVNLTAAQTGFRAKEMATRRLLGATKGEVVLKLILESTLMCCTAFAVAFLLAEAAEPYAARLFGAKIDISAAATPERIAWYALFPARAGLRFGHRTGDAGSPLQTCGRHARIVAAPHEAGIQQSADRHSERNHRRDARHLADRLCADTPPDRCAAGIRHERHSHASPQYIRRLRPDAPAARRTAQRTVGRSGRIQQCDTAYERFELDDAI